MIFESKKLLIANTAEDSISIISFDDENFNVRTKSLYDMHFNNRTLKCINRVEKVGIHQLYRDKTTDLIYTVNSYDNSIFKIDIKENNILSHTYVGKCPTHLAMFEDRIFVSNSDSNSVSVVDKESFELIENISVGEKPHGIVLDNVNKKIFVANSSGYSMDIIDLYDYSIERVPLSYNPLHFYMFKENLYIIAGMSNGMLSSHIMIYNLIKKDIIKEVKVCNMIHNICCTSENSIFTPNVSDGYLYKIEFGEIDYTKRYHVGGMPCNLVNIDNYIYINDILNNIIIVFNHKNGKIKTRIKVGKEPSGMLIV
ncbi:hypothetical protein PV797_14675 [Clostridiaceae bacterium M8S5]|nr:hypothetical protein PV797_14675 [Clostridiaceae bacterium M8S5]